MTMAVRAATGGNATRNPYAPAPGDSADRIKLKHDTAVLDAKDEKDLADGDYQDRRHRQKEHFGDPPGASIGPLHDNTALGRMERGFSEHFLKVGFFSLVGAYGGSLVSRNMPLWLDRPIPFGIVGALAGFALSSTFIDHHWDAGKDEIKFDPAAAKAELAAEQPAGKPAKGAR